VPPFPINVTSYLLQMYVVVFDSLILLTVCFRPMLLKLKQRSFVRRSMVVTRRCTYRRCHKVSRQKQHEGLACKPNVFRAYMTSGMRIVAGFGQTGHGNLVVIR
jgi:hypothetical protein